ncbi:hypothetical protein C8R44DRAFT_858110 [Mycena epipterygia]|nr:hypothetical protein C8R44DRAFT_858110 [Mycena epipterygia]
MPQVSSSIFENLIQYTQVAARNLQDIGDETQAPFLCTIGTVALSISALMRVSRITLPGSCNEIELQTLSGAGVATAVIELEMDIEQRHNHLLELIAARTDIESCDTTSSIFYGRDTELQHIVTTLLGDSPRIAILGTGGMGKTTLATMALHYPSIQQKFNIRHFVSCESATNAADLTAIVGSHLGLEVSKHLSAMILKHFMACGPAALLLDNMETPWEQIGSRAEVEEFLSLLADIPHLALLITIRGAERPEKVKWSRPFLPPLKPLTYTASRQTFIEIADDPTINEEPALEELLELSGNLPLAVSLIANVASFEGYSKTLSRWKTENLALLSEGYDKRSNLEKSISLSLTSPRMKSTPNAMDLLNLLALLPDGITERDLLHSFRPGRSLVWALYNYFQELLVIWEKRQGRSSNDLVPQLVSNLGNIHSVVLWRLKEDGTDIQDIGETILALDAFSDIMLRGSTSLMQYLPDLIHSTRDDRLHWLYMCSKFSSVVPGSVISAVEADIMIPKCRVFFQKENNLVGEAKFCNEVAAYYGRAHDLSNCLEFNELGLSLAKKAGHDGLRLKALLMRGWIEYVTGNYHSSIGYGQEAHRLCQLTGRLEADCEAFHCQAISLIQLGRYPDALTLCSQAHQVLSIVGMEGSDRDIALLNAESEIHHQKSEYTEAKRINELIVNMTSPDISPYHHSNSLASIAALDIIIGVDEVDIIGKLSTARRLSEKLEWTAGVISCEVFMALLYLRRGETQKATDALMQTLPAAYRYTDIAIWCLEKLGDPTYGMFGLEDTTHWAGIYLSFARKTKNLGHTYQALRCLGDIFLAHGDRDTALNIFLAVLEGSTEMDVHRRRADCMARIGDIFMESGKPKEAVKMWEAARPMFLLSSQNKDAASMDTRLAQFADL